MRERERERESQERQRPRESDWSGETEGEYLVLTGVSGQPRHHIDRQPRVKLPQATTMLPSLSCHRLTSLPLTLAPLVT